MIQGPNQYHERIKCPSVRCTKINSGRQIDHLLSVHMKPPFKLTCSRDAEVSSAGATDICIWSVGFINQQPRQLAIIIRLESLSPSFASFNVKPEKARKRARSPVRNVKKSLTRFGIFTTSFKIQEMLQIY